MQALYTVTHIDYRHDYVYRIVFDDGLGGEVDFRPYLERGPVFTPLADLDYFRSSTVDGGTICWPNGADVAPERLRELVETAA
jgi:hypothetical protein